MLNELDRLVTNDNLTITVYAVYATHASFLSTSTRLVQHDSDVVNRSVGSHLAMQAQLKP